MTRARRLLDALPLTAAVLFIGAGPVMAQPAQAVPPSAPTFQAPVAPADPEPQPEPGPGASPPEPGAGSTRPGATPGPSTAPGRPSQKPSHPPAREPSPGRTPQACEVTGGDCSPVGWGLDDLFDIPGMIVNAITSFLGLIVEQIMKPLRELLADTLLATPNVTKHADLKRLWTGAMGITAGIYVLFVTAGGVTVMGYETVQTRYALKQIAPRLLLGMIASATSLTVMGKAIWLGNALSHAIMGLGMADAGQGLIERALPFSLFGAPGLKIYLLIISILMIALILAVVIGYVVRVAVMALLAVSGPLALACHAHPLTDPVARLWWRALAGCLVIQVAQSMMFIVALKLFFAPGATALGIPYSDQLGTMLAGVALFWVLFKIPGWTMQVVFRATPIHNPHAPTAVRILRHLAMYRLMDRYLPGMSLLGHGRGGGRPGGGGGGLPGRGGIRPPGPRPGGGWLRTVSGRGPTPRPASGLARASRVSAAPAGSAAPRGGLATPVASGVGGLAVAPAAMRLAQGSAQGAPSGRPRVSAAPASSPTPSVKGPRTVMHPSQARRKQQLKLSVAAQRVPRWPPRPVQTWLPIRADRVPRAQATPRSLSFPSSARPPMGQVGPRVRSRQLALPVPAERVRLRPARPAQLWLPLEPPRR